MNWLQTLAAISGGIRQGQEDAQRQLLQQEEESFNRWKRGQMMNDALMNQALMVKNQAWQDKQRAFDEKSMARKEAEWAAADRAKNLDRAFVQPFENGMVNSFSPDGQRTLTVPTPAPAMNLAGKAMSAATGGMVPVIPFGTSVSQVQSGVTLSGVKSQKDFEEEAADKRYINKTLELKEKLADEGLIRDYDRFPPSARGGTRGGGRSSTFTPPDPNTPVGKEYAKFISQGFGPKEAYRAAGKSILKPSSKEMKKFDDVPEQYRDTYFAEMNRLKAAAKENDAPITGQELHWRSIKAVKARMEADAQREIKASQVGQDADQELLATQGSSPISSRSVGDFGLRGQVAPYVPRAGLNALKATSEGAGIVAPFQDPEELLARNRSWNRRFE